MKLILQFIFTFYILITTLNLHSQVVVTIPVKLNDYLSKKAYSAISKEHASILANSALQNKNLKDMKKLLTSQNSSLYIINPLFLNNRIYLSLFIMNKSKKFIYREYPILSNIISLYPYKAVQNALVRKRFYRKLLAEKEALDPLFVRTNYISEGKRIALALDVIHNTILISLENAEK
jgi:hypothetical protein